MSSYRDILRARLSGDPQLLNEVSLGRVWHHVQKSAEESLGIVTAWRAGNSKRENQTLNQRLMGDIRSLGLGAFKLVGHWRECQDEGVPYEKCPDDQLVDSVEASFGVPGISRADILRLAKKYRQDAVVYMGPETRGSAILLFKDGNEMKIGKFSPGKIAQAYSKVRGGSFVFEGWDYPAQTHIESLIEASAKGRR